MANRFMIAPHTLVLGLTHCLIQHSGAMKRMLHSIRTHPTTRMTIAFATGILVPWYALLHYTTILEEQRAK